jgi:dTMP kinase
MLGRLITFEGGEGTGKSTQITLLAERLRSGTGGVGACTVRLVREPGGTALGEDVRRILKHAPYGETLDDCAELLLFAASRAQLCAEVIRPALERGEVVLCDRFADSSLAYQGSGRGLPTKVIRMINDFATGGLRPDLTVLLDLPPAVGLERVKARTQAVPAAAPAAPAAPAVSQDRMETLDLAFYERVREAFLDMAEYEPERILKLDASEPPAVIAEKIWVRIPPLLASKTRHTALKSFYFPHDF